jgi:hypothetical protein
MHQQPPSMTAIGERDLELHDRPQHHLYHLRGGARLALRAHRRATGATDDEQPMSEHAWILSFHAVLPASTR